MVYSAAALMCCHPSHLTMRENSIWCERLSSDAMFPIEPCGGTSSREPVKASSFRERGRIRMAHMRME